MVRMRRDLNHRRWNLNTHHHPVLLDAIPTDAATALDVGSGDGVLAFDLAAQGLDVTGIDVDSASVRRASEDPEATDRTTFHHGDVFIHPFEPPSFDFVTSNAMLHHVDARAGLERMAELVRPGGVVAIVGFATASALADRVATVTGALLMRFQMVRGRYREHQSPMRWPPPLSMDEMRSLVDDVMPGATFRRELGSRYSLVWTRPTTDER